MVEYKVVVTEHSTKWFNLEGQIHRKDGPAIKDANGNKWYCVNGKCHRENGPAMENTNGDKWYYINGELHREDGPAIEYGNGNKSYYIHGKGLTKQEFNDRKTKPCIDKVVEIEGVKYKLIQI